MILQDGVAGDPGLIGSIFFWAKSGFIKIQNHSDLNPDPGSYLVFLQLKLKLIKRLKNRKQKMYFVQS